MRGGGDYKAMNMIISVSQDGELTD